MRLIPEGEPLEGTENRLTLYQLVRRLHYQFWTRWSSEYLHHLQERSKWRNPRENFAPGQLVTLRDDRYPLSKLPLGRILETNPGPDGLIRVVNITPLYSCCRPKTFLRSRLSEVTRTMTTVRFVHRTKAGEISGSFSLSV